MPNQIQYQRNSKGHFVKGDIVLIERIIKINKARKGKPFTEEHKKKLKKSHKGMKGHTAWNKGNHIQLNTGKTHFKKGMIPHNYKGGISKTREYKSFYNRRYKARKKNASGNHTFGDWENLKAQYNWTCPCCHKNEVKLTQDHIIPLSKGGSDNIENIQPLCASCNSSKHTKIIKY